MKKAGIITFLHNDNYGSILQAWALQQAVRECGWEASHIDYAPDTKEKIMNQITQLNSPALLLDGLRKRRVNATRSGAKSKHEAFSAFLCERMTITRRCANRKQLSKCAGEFDLLIAGSDQIWSPVWFNPRYFLDFGDDIPCISYAASLGVSSFRTSGIKAVRIKRLLRRFRLVSAREQEGARLLEKITGRDIDVVPDPVMLVEPEKWHGLAENVKQDTPYLLCYFIGDRQEYWTEAKHLAEEHHLSIVIVPVQESAWQQGQDVADGLGPAEWLGYMANADIVLTDSFHGACFSALLNRRFKVLRRYEDQDRNSKNSRVDQLMRHLRCETDRLLEPADYTDGLRCLREQGIEWLKKALGQV